MRQIGATDEQIDRERERIRKELFDKVGAQNEFERPTGRPAEDPV